MSVDDPKQASDGVSDRAPPRPHADDETLTGEGSFDRPGDDVFDSLTHILAAQISLDMLERVWPRARDRPRPSDELESVPASFGRFRVVRELGRGAFGVVFLAIDPRLDRPIALKLPRPQVLLTDESRSRLLREARAAAALDHPNIVPLYE